MSLRRLAAAALVLVSLASVGVAQAAPKADKRCPAPRCSDIRIPAPPGITISGDHARVVLPVGYAKSTRRYPVVFMLNGALGDYREWSQNSDVVSYSAQFPAIFVFPDGGAGKDAGWFSDWRDGTWQWESWHINTVVPYIDAHYRTIPTQRAIVGPSMGANGALTYPARHPGVFKTAVAMSGWFDTQLGTPATQYVAANDSTAPQDMSRVWGEQLLNADVWAQHNPTALAPQLKGTEVFVSQGSGSYLGAAGAHGGQREANLFLCIPTFLKALDDADVVHHDLVYAGGEHSWDYFTKLTRWAFPLMMDSLAGRPVVDDDPAPMGLQRLPLGNSDR
jgi:diacylglycerol O-acyltransferase/trehalose O-mycolyltransferase